MLSSRMANAAAASATTTPLASLLEPDASGVSLTRQLRLPSIVRTGINSLDARLVGDDAHQHAGNSNAAAPVLSGQQQLRSDYDVVEISGKAGTGKTELLLRLILAYVLPKSVGGLESIVLLFDLEGRLSIPRITALLTTKLGHNMGELRGCLDRVQVIRCASSLELLATLHGLTGVLDAPGGGNVRLMAFDSLSAFYWQDCATEPNGGGLFVSIPNAVKDLVHQFNLTVVATRPELFGNSQQQTSRSSTREDYTSKTWRDTVTWRIKMEPSQDPTSVIVGLVNLNQNCREVVPLIAPA